MSLYDSFQTNTGLTANGALTNVTSLDSNVDLFFLLGASRGKDISGVFMQALANNEDLAIRTLLWGRDVRGGAGERKLFRDLLKVLVLQKPNLAKRVAAKIPEVGRYDDLWCEYGTSTDHDAFVLDLVVDHLSKDGNKNLLAKWLPRKGKNSHQGKLIKDLRRVLGLKTPKQYRKLIVGLTNVVEQDMCGNKWEGIEFEKLPSLASSRYQNAFGKHCQVRYQEYQNKLEKGEAKVNASALYPYDVVKSLRKGNTAVSNAQWKALPNYLEGSKERILPMVDVSGSMACSAGGSGEITCMDVAISLGLYISEHNEGIFKDTFMSFTSRPQMHKLQGTLEQRLAGFRGRGLVGYDTNIQLAFEELLRVAQSAKLPESEMPTKILILSDMEFNNYSIRGTDVHTFQGVRQAYEEAGYKAPQIVFWNLNGREGNVPVKADQTGTALVSGFSPSIMTSLLGDDTFSPEGIMVKTLMSDRYTY